MLTVGQNHNVKFKVNVMGTSAEPRVRVILGTVPELSFVANKEADDWVSNLSVPAHVVPGDYDMRVEVHLNNRLFTPINKKINVKGIELPEPVAAAKDPIGPGETPVLVKAPSAAPEVKPSGSLMSDIAKDTGPRPKVKAPEMPKVVAKLSPVELKKTVDEAELAAAVLDAPAPPMSELQKIAKAPVQPMRKRFESKKAPSSTPIRVSISEIDAVTTSKVSHVIEACKPVKVPRKASKGSTTVKLVKEQLFYE